MSDDLIEAMARSMFNAVDPIHEWKIGSHLAWSTLPGEENTPRGDDFGMAACRVAARAALAVVREREGWRTIETAPRDGKPILTWTNGYVDIRTYRGTRHGWLNAQDSKRNRVPQPTHWRALPPPPEAE